MRLYFNSSLRRSASRSGRDSSATPFSSLPLFIILMCSLYLLMLRLTGFVVAGYDVSK